MITTWVKSWANRCGVDIARYRPDAHHGARYRRLLETLGITQVLDVGANTGQFGALLRSAYGYRGAIVSFEPLEKAHIALSQKATGDPERLWRVASRMALGATNGSSTIHVASNSVSSSILPMEQLHTAAAPSSEACDVEEIIIRRLDDVLQEMGAQVDRHTMLKIDTQGYELEVLQGAERTIRSVGVIQAEMSFQPLYGGQPLFGEVYDFITGLGFDVFDMVPGFADPRSGQLLQVDGIFVRRH